MDIPSKVGLQLHIAHILRGAGVEIDAFEGVARAMEQSPGIEKSHDIIAINDSTLGRLLEGLGIKDYPQSRAMTLFALLQGIPLNEKNIDYLLSKRFKTSILYKVIIEKGLLSGYNHEVEDLKDSFPTLENLATFIENIDKNIELAEGQVSKLFKLLIGDNNLNLENILGDLYSGMLFQLDHKLPFHMMQIPLKVEEDIHPSEIWMDKDKDIFYLEIILPNLKTIGCLVKDWKTSLTMILYCRPEFQHLINNKLKTIKDILENLGFKCGSMEVSNIENESGLYTFLLPYDVQYKLVDISI
ncbi:MAG TPA: hypothetical protein VFD57_05365 [Clostridia bacterium]|nr:hypothetical protein [Clostridia bacterium]